ncbi:sulfatase [Engelhardtia mirabilis]|uniref:Choline-sulfatase n=1 Tax=Engelhardtia mirabilis TaxID=2528011 RepID=A0A518BKY8_9BACT|nr:Choline-sulfatase [Planctomycetes bacterium Pla133]QDV01961.1 Choline-sulfatase [Planctomycetes bacterium Pla86]
MVTFAPRSRPGVLVVGIGILAALPVMGGLSLLSGTATSLEAAPPQAPRATRPHLILVSLDTLRADHLGCYGHDRPTSPFLDELARKGVLFEDVAAPSSKTAPSHMSMFTGVHPTVHGVRNYYGRAAWAPSDDLPTVIERASQAGYITAGFTGGGMMSSELGFGRGFDLYDARGGGADRVFERAIAWIDDAAGDVQEDESVFLFLHTYEIHDPYTPPLEWQAKFVDPNYSGGIDSTRTAYPEDAAEAWKADRSFYRNVQERFWGGFDGRKESEYDHLRDLYDSGIAFTDHLLRGVFEELEKVGWLESSIVIVTSDHGDGFGEHGTTSHQSIFDEILHVPLIAILPESYPDARRGARVTAPVMGVDLASTIVELLGLDPLPDAQGASWAAHLRGSGGPSGHAVDYRAVWSELATPGNEWLALRRGPYKYLLHSTDTAQRALFDRWFDPGERFNRAGDMPQVVERLARDVKFVRAANEQVRLRYPAIKATMGDSSLGALHALGYAEEGDDGDYDDEDPAVETSEEGGQ